MAHVLLLVSAEGATLAETRLDEGASARAAAEAGLREEAQVCGFAPEEIAAARFVLAGDPPDQP